MIDYKAFKSVDEKNRILVEFLEAQERDHYVHTINRQRYQDMLPTLADGPFKERIQRLLAETEDRLGEVEAIIVATQATAPKQADIDTMVADIRQRRALEK